MGAPPKNNPSSRVTFIGNLYSKYPEDFLNKRLCAIVGSPEQDIMFCATIRRAKFYYYKLEDQMKNYIGLEDLSLDPDISK